MHHIRTPRQPANFNILLWKRLFGPLNLIKLLLWRRPPLRPGKRPWWFCLESKLFQPLHGSDRGGGNGGSKWVDRGCVFMSLLFFWLCWSSRSILRPVFRRGNVRLWDVFVKATLVGSRSALSWIHGKPRDFLATVWGHGSLTMGRQINGRQWWGRESVHMTSFKYPLHNDIFQE